MVEEERVVKKVMNGWKGRRKSGKGEKLWKLRKYVKGEQMERIDWRRYEREEKKYVRESEWE